MIGLLLRNGALAALASILISSVWGQAQLTPRVQPPRQIIETDDTPSVHLRLDTSLVLVPVQAIKGDQPVLDLKPEQFQLFENDEQQPLRYFSQDDAPVSVGLLWDSSGSMKNKVTKAARAAQAFFRTANPSDEFFLITFDESARVVSRFTSDTVPLEDAIRRTRPFGRTSLFDAVQLALENMKHAKYRRRALLILSDGDDNRSRHSFAAIKNMALESEVQIYAMGVFDQAQQGSEPVQDPPGSALLSTLAELTGGRHFSVEFSGLEETAERLGRLMRNEYLVGYSPSNAERDGTYRKITVKVSTDSPVALTYRRGYRAPDH